VDGDAGRLVAWDDEDSDIGVALCSRPRIWGVFEGRFYYKLSTTGGCNL
jgi:hypothetical protein